MNNLDLDKGQTCPCCGQFAKRYRRNLSFTQIKSLVELYRRPAKDWHHCKDFDTAKGGNVMCKARYWGLVEQKGVDGTTNKKNSGFWRLTQKGRDFLDGKLTIPKYALVYNNVCQAFAGKELSVRECVKKGFSYSELMGE